VWFLVFQCVDIATVNFLRLLHWSETAVLRSNSIKYSLLDAADELEASVATRPQDLKSKRITGAMSLCSIALFVYLYFFPCMRFDSTGLLSSYITRDGPSLKVAFDTVGYGVFQHTHPFHHAILFAFWFYVNLIVCPNILAALGLLAWLVPDHRKGVRRVVAELGTLILPWCMHEVLLIAVFFVCPNIHLVSHWIFDDQEPCPSIEKKTHDLEDCLIVEGTILAAGGSCAVLWALSLMVVSAYLTADARKTNSPLPA